MHSTLLNYFTLLFALLGLAIASHGAVSADVMAASLHLRKGELFVYHDNSSVFNSSTIASPSPTTTLPLATERRLLDIDFTHIIQQEPGFVLLSLSFVIISGGMVFL